MTTEPATIPPPTEPQASPHVTIVLTTVILVLFFIGFFMIYFCKCFMQNVFLTWNSRRNHPGTHIAGLTATCQQGLDPSIVSTFPTFIYSNVKDFRRETYGLECAICLCEFEDDNVLRLLTKCYHVFHQECIDLWLESHKTCPFCRRSLETPINSPEKTPFEQNSTPMHEIHENEVLEDTFTINIQDHEVNEANNNNADHTKEESGKGKHVTIEMDRQDRPDDQEGKSKERFSRNNSTGHSISKSSKAVEDQDRFTLRLPENIRAKLMIHGHNLTRSCTEFGEIETGTSRFGEVSSSSDIQKVKVTNSRSLHVDSSS